MTSTEKFRFSKKQLRKKIPLYFDGKLILLEIVYTEHFIETYLIHILLHFFLVKGKMNPTLTHNKLYLLSHDELINPVKTIRSKTLKTKIYKQFQSRSSSENKTVQQSGQVEGLLKSSSYLRSISLQSNSIHVTSTLFHNNALSRVHTGGEERS